ncbi:MAG: hypothetical protein AB7H66_04700 [Hyphomonadaceae bacterium]
MPERNAAAAARDRYASVSRNGVDLMRDWYLSSDRRAHAHQRA